MGRNLEPEQVARLRMRHQLLQPRAVDGGVAGAVRAVVGLQAQDPGAASLGVRARCEGVTAADVQAAREERSVLRAWVMRGTLHLVAAEDLGWLLPLFAPIFLSANRRRRLQLGLDDEACERGTRLVADVLPDSEGLTRGEIVERLAARGLVLEGQARPHLLSYAALSGVICGGPERNGEPTYVRLADRGRAPSPLPREVALAELARRYLAAFAPATPEDLAAWSGLPIADARKAWALLADELEELHCEERVLWGLRGQEIDARAEASDMPMVRLLPAFDSYGLGYRNRDLVVPPRHVRRINAGGGMVHPSIVHRGLVVGTWRTRRQRHGLIFQVDLFEPSHEDLQPELQREAADVGRFLGVPAALEVSDGSR